MVWTPSTRCVVIEIAMVISLLANTGCFAEHDCEDLTDEVEIASITVEVDGEDYTVRLDADGVLQEEECFELCEDAGITGNRKPDWLECRDEGPGDSGVQLIFCKQQIVRGCA